MLFNLPARFAHLPAEAQRLRTMTIAYGVFGFAATLPFAFTVFQQTGWHWAPAVAFGYFLLSMALPVWLTLRDRSLLARVMFNIGGSVGLAAMHAVAIMKGEWEIANVKLLQITPLTVPWMLFSWRRERHWIVLCSGLGALGLFFGTEVLNPLLEAPVNSQMYRTGFFGYLLVAVLVVLISVFIYLLVNANEQASLRLEQTLAMLHNRNLALETQTTQLATREADLERNLAEMRSTQAHMQQVQAELEQRNHEAQQMARDLLANREQLERLRQQDAWLVTFADAYRWTEDVTPQHWAHRVLDYLAGELHFQHGTLYWLESRATPPLLVPLAHYAALSTDAGAVPLDEGLLGEACRVGEPLVLDLDTTHLALSELGGGAMRLVPRRLHILPLLYQSRLVGALQMMSVQAEATLEPEFVRGLCMVLAGNLASLRNVGLRV